MRLTRFHKTIFGRLLITHVVLVLIPLLLVGGFSLSVPVGELTRRTIELRTAALALVAGRIDFFVDQVVSLVNACNSDERLVALLKADSQEPDLRVVSSYHAGEALASHAATFGSLDADIVLLGARGIVAVFGGFATDMTFDRLSASAWYRRLLADANRIHWLPPGTLSADGSGEPQMVAAALVVDPYQRTALGVILIGIAESSVRSLYRELAREEGTRIRLFDGEGAVLSDSAADGSGWPPASPASGARGSLVISRPVNRFGWTIVESAEAGTVRGQIMGARVGVWLACAVSLLLALAMAARIAGGFSRPLAALADRVVQYQAAPATGPARQGRSRHIEYDLLLERLGDTVAQVVRDQEARRVAELRALRAQINPHFLFNTLNSIKCLVWTARTDRVEPTINALTRMLELYLRNPDKPVRVEEAVANLGHYILIQSVRLDREVPLICRISPEAASCLVPRFLLQPLVENAVFHGLEPRQGEGTIWLNAECRDGESALEVIDNGVGCEQDLIDRALAAPEPERGDHIGLQNVARRIALTYGNTARLTVQSRPGSGTSARITLPRIEAGPDDR